MSTYRLIYRSTATQPITPDMAKNIANASAASNEALGVTGLLLSSERHFFQVLEGSQKAVSHILGKIMRDPRHEEIILVCFREVAGRGFANWSMYGVGMGLVGRWLDGKLAERYGDDEGNVAFPLDEQEAISFLRDVVSHLTDTQPPSTSS